MFLQHSSCKNTPLNGTLQIKKIVIPIYAEFVRHEFKLDAGAE